MTTTEITEMRPTGGKTLMDLGHLSMPNTSHPPKSWLATQAEQREKAIQALTADAKAWFNIERMPEAFYRGFAEKAISTLDNL